MFSLHMEKYGTIYIENEQTTLFVTMTSRYNDQYRVSDFDSAWLFG